jgi:hypothetical protein
MVLLFPDMADKMLHIDLIIISLSDESSMGKNRETNEQNKSTVEMRNED